MPPSLQVSPARFRFRAVGTVRFPPGKAGNVFRGGLGAALRRLACVSGCTGPAACPRAADCAYALLFEPRARAGPSGFANPPRPFVIRAAALDGRTVDPGEPFDAGVLLFGDPAPDARGWLQRSFDALAREGLGAGRGKAELASAVFDPPVAVQILPSASAATRFAVEFLTPADLKAGGSERAAPAFHTLFARARDRVAALMEMYGTGAPQAAYRDLGEAARSIRTVRSDLCWTETPRRSSRTGQSHGIGGFTGRVEYSGAAAPFLPWLHAAAWTGVGRHTVWGNGVIRVTEYP